ncbi:MAG: nucleotidyltransferase family protein [Bacteroidia bacterium]|nr:nucleotidyltransferase family protein [Bacteroidia bacterium]
MKSPLIEILSPFPVSAISINSVEFSRCAELARRHGVEMLFYSRLKKHYVGSNECIDDYLKQNEHSYLKTVARSIRQEVVEKEIVAALSKHHIPACIIKGNDIARVLYEDPNCRGSADIDVLIRTSDLIDADNILCNKGFVREDTLPLSFWIGRLHHAVYSNAKNICLLELHWDFGYPLYFNLTPDEIWNGVVESDTEGYSLTPETMVVLLFMHHFRHGFREFKILVDILWSFHRYDRIINWQEFAVKLKKIGLIKTALIILDQLDSLWRLSDGRIESFKILQKRLASLPIHTPKFLLWYFKIDIEKEYKTSGALDMEMSKLVLDKKSKVMYSFVKILFPRPQDIRGFYPGTSKLTLPLNYLRFICWRVTKWTVFTK